MGKRTASEVVHGLSIYPVLDFKGTNNHFDY